METDVLALRQEAGIEAYGQGVEATAFQSRLTAGIMGFISVAGLICNVIVVLIICTLKEYKQTTNWYLLNLAFADIMFLALLPFNLVQSLLGKWTFGLPLCVAFQGAFYITYYAGVLFLAVMSFDRYIAIAHPMSNPCRRIRSIRGSRLIAFAVWIVAISAAAPLMAKTTVDDVCDFSFDYIHPDCEANQISAKYCDLWRKAQGRPQFGIQDSGNQSVEELYYHITEDGYEDQYEDYDLPSVLTASSDFILLQASAPDESAPCTRDNRDYVTWIVGNFMLSFVVPLTVMAGCYGGILWQLQHRKLEKSTRKRRNYSASYRRACRGLDKKVRITILVVSLVAVFVVCWLPFHAVILAKVKGINLHAGACAKLELAVVLIAYSNSLLNPLMYTFLGIRFNNRLKMTVSRTFNRTPSVVRTDSSKDGTKNNSEATMKFAKASTSEVFPARSDYIPMRLLTSSQKEEDKKENAAPENNEIVGTTSTESHIRVK